MFVYEIQVNFQDEKSTIMPVETAMAQFLLKHVKHWLTSNQQPFSLTKRLKAFNLSSVGSTQLPTS